MHGSQFAALLHPMIPLLLLLGLASVVFLLYKIL